MIFIDIFVNLLIRKPVFIILQQQTIASEKDLLFSTAYQSDRIIINSKTVLPSSQYVRGIHKAPGGTVLQWREMASAVPGDTDDWLF